MKFEIKTKDQLAAERFETIRKQIILAIDNHVENTAKRLGYNSAAHCASYVSSTVASWSEEALEFVKWRDSVWLSAFGYVPPENIENIEALIADAIAHLPKWQFNSNTK